MSTEESKIYQYLKQQPHRHVPIEEIIQHAGDADDFVQDRNWMLAILRRMEIEGWVISDARGEYRVKPQPEETTSFKKALETPGTPLGDTTIISLHDVQDESRAEAV